MIQLRQISFEIFKNQIDGKKCLELTDQKLWRKTDELPISKIEEEQNIPLVIIIYYHLSRCQPRPQSNFKTFPFS